MNFLVLGVAGSLALMSAALAQNAVETRTVKQAYPACLETIRRTAGQLGETPVNVVETAKLRVVRFCTSDGSVLMTCSADSGEQAITVSPHRCGG